MTGSDVALACEDLTKRYGDRTAVEAVTLQVARGEVFALLGPNGAGKTTTVRMLCGLVAPTSGRVFIAGKEVTDDDPSFRARVGTLPETPGLYERLSPEANLDFYGALFGLTRKETRARAESLLRTFGLWDRRHDAVSGFSKGMKQKVAIIRAMLHRPEVLFLDEPTSGLDPEASREVREQLHALKRAGTTILLTTHRLEEAHDLADRVGVLRTRLLAVDTLTALRRQLYGTQVCVRFGGDDEVEKALAVATAVPGVKSSRREGDRAVIVDVATPDTVVPGLVRALVEAGHSIRAVEDVDPSLEQMYFEILKRGG